MKPIRSYLKKWFGAQKILGDSTPLQGLAKADALLLALVNQNKVPGIGVTVLRQGEVLLQKGYGYANLETKTPVHPDKTLFRIASVSKPIAATALAKMVADKDIDLDASLYDYVPYFPKKEHDFTIRQLAGHTAGIRGYRGKEYALNMPYSIKEGITVFQEDALLFTPGTDYHYNSYDWALISLAMQEVSGIPFEEYVYDKVLQPLGIQHIYPELPETTLPHCASFYSKSQFGFRKATAVNNFYKLAGGGYLATSKEVAQFGQAMLQGNLGDASVMQAFLTPGEVGGKSTYYGLGWQVSQDAKGRPYYGHVGNGVGGYANFFVYPEQDMVFSITMNCTNPNVQTQLDEIIHTVIESV